MKISDRVVVGVIAFISRWFIVLWGAKHIPPAADGTYYHVLATRIAQGHGYTWLWPDGAVTHAAHYPVGYPALVAAGYAVFGAKPAVAMAVNAALGIAAAIAVHDMLVRATTRGRAFAGGVVMALHPALAPYTVALMTEGVTASLLVVVAALADRARSPAYRSRGWIVAAGIVLGFATLVRPQNIVLAPILGFLSVAPGSSFARRLSFAAGITVLALAVCAPWTARNCKKMERCALVSVNGGWNLAIGTQTLDGGWTPIDVPERCKEVFQEAAKDTCFGAEAMATIRARPRRWLARMPAKLRVTFDYLGAAPWYLHTANASAFPHRAKVVLGGTETFAVRVLLAAAILAAMRAAGPLRRTRLVVGGLALGSCLLVAGAIAYGLCALLVLLLGARTLARAPIFVPLTAVVIVATAATHAVFFGSGRYGLVVVPFVTALAFWRQRSMSTRATS